MLIIRNPEEAHVLPANHPAHARLHLLDLGPVVIIETGDTEQDIINEIGFSPLVNRVEGNAFHHSLSHRTGNGSR